MFSSSSLPVPCKQNNKERSRCGIIRPEIAHSMHHVDRKLIMIMPGIRCPGYIVRLVGYIQGGGEKNVTFTTTPLLEIWAY